MLANFSNHPSAVWSAEQKAAAAEYGEIRDLTFPAVPAGADTADVSALADECCREILALGADAVLVQGEMSLSFAVAGRLQIRGVTVLCACSERVCDTAVLSDGSTERRSVFRFVRFREYPTLL